jgi:hypothetical protein
MQIFEANPFSHVYRIDKVAKNCETDVGFRIIFNNFELIFLKASVLLVRKREKCSIFLTEFLKIGAALLMSTVGPETALYN